MIRYESLRLTLINRRKQLGISQKQLADRMGLHQTALNNLETGNRPNPTIETLAVWCRALNGGLDIGVTFDDDVQPERCWLRNSSPTQTCGCRDVCADDMDELLSSKRRIARTTSFASDR